MDFDGWGWVFCIFILVSCSPIIVGEGPSQKRARLAAQNKSISALFLISAFGTSGTVGVAMSIAPTTISASDTGQMTNANPMNLTNYALSPGAVTGAFAEHCIRENSIDASGCSWITGSTLPEISLGVVR